MGTVRDTNVKTEDGSPVSNRKNMVGEMVYGGIAQYLCGEINKRYTEFQFRTTTLGHLQRSGVPAAFDRLLASLFGAKAVELLEKGEDGKMVVWKDGEVSAVKAAIDAADKGGIKKPVGKAVIANPHEEIWKVVNKSAERLQRSMLAKRQATLKSENNESYIKEI